MNKEKLIVDIWEKCFNQHILESALTILNSTYPNVDKKDFAEMSLGKRNYLLTRVHENLFGKSLYCVVSCPECNSQSEFIIATDEITSLNTNEEKRAFAFQSDDFKIIYKLPDSYDLASASKYSEVQSVLNDLLNRCIIKLSHNEQELLARDLPEEIVQKLSEEISKNDPCSETLINLSCQNCKHEWNSVFDIASFLSRSINHYAKNILSDIHSLASAYGWNESEILNMTPQKRNWYIEALGVR